MSGYFTVHKLCDLWDEARDIGNFLTANGYAVFCFPDVR